MAQKLYQSGYKCKGSTRFLNQGDVAYIRLSNIVDSIPIYNAIQKDADGLSVEYISPALASQVMHTVLCLDIAANTSQSFSPHRQSFTAHEGQVVLKVKYPVTRASNKGAFELQIRDLLAVEGPIRAWQKIVATEAGVYHLVAEFEDSSHAGRAIQRLNGTKVGVSFALALSSLQMLTVIRILLTQLSSVSPSTCQMSNQPTSRNMAALPRLPLVAQVTLGSSLHPCPMHWAL